MSQTAVSVAAAVMAVVAVSAQYEPTLQYQRRGDRDEGLRTIAVSGLDIELVSARIDGPKPSNGIQPTTKPAWAESVTARFYLPETSGVYLAVRQLRSQSTYYWLTLPPRDVPARPNEWNANATNEYAWTTSTVLAKLRDVRLDDLGAVVRLSGPTATNVQRVLPVALFDREPITRVDSYRFSWRPLSRLHVTVDIFPSGRGQPKLFGRSARWEDAGSPFTILWSPVDAPEGWYRLVLSGFFENNIRLDREVEFYHRPALTDAIGRKPRA